MNNLFQVTIQPVELSDRDSVKRIIMRMLGPNSNQKTQFLLENGGIVFKGLNEEAAKDLVNHLQQAGAEAEIGPIEDEQEEKQQLFRIILISSGEKNIQLIKAIRKETGIGLRESKKLVENLGIINEGVPRLAALKTISRLIESGAKIIVEPIGNFG